MEWFSAAFPDALSEEVIEGVRVVRAGQQWTVHWAAYRRYHRRLEGDFDVVIDEVNTIPFFTPLWSPIPIVMLIHQLAREVWWYESRFPISAIGFLTEPFYLRCYRNVPVLTVSSSTESDLRRLGLKGPITVIPEGLERIETPLNTEKTADPSFLCVGRLAPSKRLHHALRALAMFRGTTGKGTLWLVGDGTAGYKRRLQNLANRLHIAEHVVFWGRVETMDKHRLMTAAHVLLVPSVREGWGLVVSEANACGTPAIVYDVPGLRDSVRHDVTGLVVRAKPACLSEAMLRLVADTRLYARLASRGRQCSATLSFDRAAQLVAAALDAAVVA